MGWRRLGPLRFAYQPELDTDLNLFPNKDCVWFPEPVPGPSGSPAYAMLHRPMWDLSWIRPGEGTHVPTGIEGVSYVFYGMADTRIGVARLDRE
jgi:beta-1,2-mannobiose phosphorylase / 1,2-beta-oligomannan phosphorylase